MAKRQVVRANRGNQPHTPTIATQTQAREFSAAGLTQEQVAALMGVDPKTLRRYYWDEIHEGKAQAVLDVGKNILTMAKSETHKSAFQAAQFYLQSQAGWTKQDGLTLTGPDGGPVQVEHITDVVDSRNLTPDQRDALRDIVRAAVAKRVDEEPETLEGEYEDLGDELEDDGSDLV